MNRASKYNLVWLVFAANAFAIMWFFWSAAFPHAFTSAGNLLVTLGNISGLFGMYLLLAQVLMMSRLPILEDALGMDKMARLHHTNGYLTFYLILAHPVLLIAGYQLIYHSGIWAQTLDFTFNYPDVLKAVLGVAILVGIIFLSVRIVRRNMKYETWYYVHLLTYLVIILVFGHQTKNGPEFIGHPIFRLYWDVLTYGTAALVAWFRFFLPVWRSLIYDLRVERVVAETHDSSSVYITGRGVQDFPFKAGQFAIWRFLTPQLALEAHPFSFSEAPGNDRLRLTVKNLGDYTASVNQLAPGTRVILDGPHGSFTAEKDSKKVLLIAGGIGITPLRSLAEGLLADGRDVVLIYAVKTEADIAFRSEIEELRQRGLKVRYLFSGAPSPLGASGIADITNISRLVPDVVSREVFLCGPLGMMDSVAGSLIKLGVPEHAINTERFEF